MSEKEIEALFNGAISDSYVKALVEKYNDADVIEDILTESFSIVKIVCGKWHEAKGLSYAGNKVYYRS